MSRMSRKTLVSIALLAATLLLLAGCSSPKPTGRLVVEREVDGNSDIYVLNADGSGLARLTEHPGWDGTPAWSPDGAQIAFASERQGAPAIFVMNADGSDPRPLTDGSSVSIMPVWSPDGAQIAFASSRSYEEVLTGGRQQVDAGLEIWIMDADGDNVKRITGNYEDQALYPTWAPDGSRLAFMEIGDTVHILSKRPERQATAFVLTEGLTGRHWTPAWSPNGEHIAIMAEIEGVNDIWLIRPEGGTAVNLTNSGSGDGDPAWSPDSKQIAFISNRDGPSSLYVMDADGQNVRRLTDDDSSYARPCWTFQ